jgi:hypothetical protein
MPLSYKEMSAPIAEPMTLAQAKLQCIIDSGDTSQDTVIGGLIITARQYVEKKMQRAIFPRAMRLNLDFFPFPDWSGTIGANDRHVLYGKYWHALMIRLPLVATLSVQSITYIDLAGTLQTLDPSQYYVDLTSEPARIVPMPGLYWPYTQSYLPGSVTILYTAATYALPVSDALVVPATGPYTVTLSMAAAFSAGTSLLVANPTLVDSTGAAVAFSNAANVLTVAGTYAGQTLTASYYIGNCPATITQAMSLLISYWFTHRDAAEANPPKAIEMGIDALLATDTFDTFGYQA